MPKIIPQKPESRKTDGYQSFERWSLVPHKGRVFVQAIRRKESVLGPSFSVKHGWSTPSSIASLIRQLNVEFLSVAIIAGKDSEATEHASLMVALKPLAVRKDFTLVSVMEERTSSELVAWVGDMADESIDFSKEEYALATFH